MTVRRRTEAPRLFALFVTAVVVAGCHSTQENDGDEFARRGDWASSYDRYYDAKQRDPDNTRIREKFDHARAELARSWAERGRRCFHDGELEDAEKAFHEAASYDFSGRNLYDAELAAVKAARSVDFLKVAREDLASRRFDSALKNVAEAVSRAPTEENKALELEVRTAYANSLDEEASSAEQAERFEEAVTLLGKSLSILSRATSRDRLATVRHHWVAALSLQGEQALEQGQFETAVSKLSQAVNLDPSAERSARLRVAKERCADSLVARSRAALESKDFEGARSLVTKAIELDDGERRQAALHEINRAEAESLIGKAESTLRAGDFEAALGLLERVVTLDDSPAHRIALMDARHAYADDLQSKAERASQADPESSVTLMEKSVQVDDTPERRARLTSVKHTLAEKLVAEGVVAESQGDLDAAVTKIDRAASLDGESGSVASAKAHAHELRAQRTFDGTLQLAKDHRITEALARADAAARDDALAVYVAAQEALRSRLTASDSVTKALGNAAEDFGVAFLNGQPRLMENLIRNTLHLTEAEFARYSMVPGGVAPVGDPEKWTPADGIVTISGFSFDRITEHGGTFYVPVNIQADVHWVLAGLKRLKVRATASTVLSLRITATSLRLAGGSRRRILVASAWSQDGVDFTKATYAPHPDGDGSGAAMIGIASAVSAIPGLVDHFAKVSEKLKTGYTYFWELGRAAYFHPRAFRLTDGRLYEPGDIDNIGVPALDADHFGQDDAIGSHFEIAEDIAAQGYVIYPFRLAAGGKSVVYRYFFPVGVTPGVDPEMSKLLLGVTSVTSGRPVKPKIRFRLNIQSNGSVAVGLVTPGGSSLMDAKLVTPNSPCDVELEVSRGMAILEMRAPSPATVQVLANDPDVGVALPSDFHGVFACSGREGLAFDLGFTSSEYSLRLLRDGKVEKTDRGTWRLDGKTLILRHGASEERATYTLIGKKLLLQLPAGVVEFRRAL